MPIYRRHVKPAKWPSPGPIALRRAGRLFDRDEQGRRRDRVAPRLHPQPRRVHDDVPHAEPFEHAACRPPSRDHASRSDHALKMVVRLLFEEASGSHDCGAQDDVSLDAEARSASVARPLSQRRARSPDAWWCEHNAHRPDLPGGSREAVNRGGEGEPGARKRLAPRDARRAWLRSPRTRLRIAAANVESIGEELVATARDANQRAAHGRTLSAETRDLASVSSTG